MADTRGEEPGVLICVGDDIEVTILSQRGDQFRVGVTAPKEVPVHRQEVYERIQEENDVT